MLLDRAVAGPPATATASPQKPRLADADSISLTVFGTVTPDMIEVTGRNNAPWKVNDALELSTGTASGRGAA